MDRNRVTRSYNDDYQNSSSVSVYIVFDAILPSLTLNRLRGGYRPSIHSFNSSLTTTSFLSDNDHLSLGIKTLYPRNTASHVRT